METTNSFVLLLLFLSAYSLWLHIMHFILSYESFFPRVLGFPSPGYNMSLKLCILLKFYSIHTDLHSLACMPKSLIGILPISRLWSEIKSISSMVDASEMMPISKKFKFGLKFSLKFWSYNFWTIYGEVNGKFSKFLRLSSSTYYKKNFSNQLIGFYCKLVQISTLSACCEGNSIRYNNTLWSIDI